MAKGARPIASFASPSDLHHWLALNHASQIELWVQIYKQSSGIPSVSWNDVVIESLVWGWIDGVKNSLDDASYLQRITPRRPKSAWSKRNRDHAERLIDLGRMMPAGLAQVTAAKADGRWETAYAGSADMVIPADFLAALAADQSAKATFETLNRANLFTIYHRLHSAKKPETRERRLRAMIDQLARGKGFH